MSSFIILGTETTPNKLGVMQVGSVLHPVCGYCFLTAPFPDEPDTDDLKWVCKSCGHNFKLEGSCDIDMSVHAHNSWIRYAVSVWTGFPEENIDICLTPASS